MDKIGQLIFYILSKEEQLIFLKKLTSKEKIMFYLFAKDTDTFNKNCMSKISRLYIE